MELSDDHLHVLRVLRNLDKEVCEHDMRLWGWENELEELQSHGYVKGEWDDRSGGFFSPLKRSGYGWCKKGTYYSITDKGSREI